MARPSLWGFAASLLVATILWLPVIAALPSAIDNTLWPPLTLERFLPVLVINTIWISFHRYMTGQAGIDPFFVCFVTLGAPSAAREVMHRVGSEI